MDEECEHGSDAATCSVCRGRKSGTASSGGRKRSAPGDPDWAFYRERYKRRPETFEAYKDVWERSSGARDFPGGWNGFSRAANAEPSMDADLVRAAEEIMRRFGYETDAKQHGVGRRWRRVRPEGDA